MNEKEKNFISAVIYVHNGEENIERFFKTVQETLEEHFEHAEIICVNDGSEDDSTDVIRQIGKHAKASVSVLNMSYFHGIEMAMNAGVDLAIGDFVFEFDSVDLDFSPSEIMNVYYRSLGGYDIVSACPDKKETFSSRMFYRVYNHFAGLPYKMSTERFRIISRRAINRIKSMNRVISYRKAVYAGCGLKKDSICYSICGSGQKKKDQRERKYRLGLAADVLILFTELGYRFSVVMTILMMLVSIFMAVYSVTVYLAASPVEGWTTTILFLSLAFCGLFGILTIIVKYLQLLVDLIFKRKHYSFESIEKLGE